MRQRAFLMLGLAAVLGIAAVFLVHGLIARHTAPGATHGVVVARVPLNVGDSLNRLDLMTVAWPASIVPDGTFSSVDQLLKPGTSRVALEPIARGEPILPAKISGPGGRASLSAMIASGMRAMTIRANEVLGVAGFVLPGDRVDVLLTRNSNADPTTDILLQNVLVLGIDQDASQKTNKPSVAHAVTLEVTPNQSEKLALAAMVGTLSLALRNGANHDPVTAGPVGLSDLRVDAPVQAKTGPVRQSQNSVRIFRGTKPTNYDVGADGGVAERLGS